MNDYEILLMLDAELPDERQNEIVTRAREAIERDGGRCRRARALGPAPARVRDRPQARGLLPPADLRRRARDAREISRVLKITDGVMRHLAVRRVVGATTRPPQAAPEEPVAVAAVASQDSETETETETETESA